MDSVIFLVLTSVLFQLATKIGSEESGKRPLEDSEGLANPDFDLNKLHLFYYFF